MMTVNTAFKASGLDDKEAVKLQDGQEIETEASVNYWRVWGTNGGSPTVAHTIS